MNCGSVRVFYSGCPFCVGFSQNYLITDSIAMEFLLTQLNFTMSHPLFSCALFSEIKLYAVYKNCKRKVITFVINKFILLMRQPLLLCRSDWFVFLELIKVSTV